jgi:peptidyl-prolyl cis-trans isomerase A (cyclophilin A)
MRFPKPVRNLVTAMFCSAVFLGLAPVSAAEEGAAAPNPALLDLSLAKETAPDTYKVKMETTAGDLVIEVHRDWAPHGADRFYNLVTIGYYDDVAFFRVLKGFMAQTGMHGDPAVSNVWLQARIPPDPVKKSNTKGMVTFAMGAKPDTRTVQFFINYGNNSFLDAKGFAVFGKVVEGFDSVKELYGGYGEGAPSGKGPDQGKLSRGGNAYLKGEFPKLDYIVTASIIE